MLEDVIKRLADFSYTVDDNEKILLNFIINKVENSIKNDCGVYDEKTSLIVIPNSLHEVVVDRVCGEFLFNIQQTGKLNNIFNSESSVKRVNVGDTTVEFGGSGNTQSLDLLIKILMSSGEKELVCYRKIKW